jgi:penicillin amidase
MKVALPADSLKHVLRFALGRRLPTTEGTLAVAGLHAPVGLRRDGYGVAYIQARNDDDAWFALGFAQAQDRAFQLELRLRTLRGTLSALFGETTLSIDRLARRVGFVEAARRQVPVLEEDVRGQIEAFVRGINAGLAAGSHAKAHEFVLLRSTPSPWYAEDVVAMGKLLSFLLIGNWDVELTRLKVLLTDGLDALCDLDPTPYPEEHLVVTPPLSKAGPALDSLGKDLEAFLAFAGHGGGSNAWAVSGARTASGKPILANDPHLEGVLPPHWYLASLETPDWHVAGAAMIGLPGFGSGHNGTAAWGVTAGFSDTSDLFIEEVTSDGRSVRRGESFEDCTMRREVIEVRGKAQVVEDVLVTPRGPVITPALDGEHPALSLRAVWLDARPARGFTQLHKVRSFADMQREFEHWPMLAQNVVYADISGDIGWQLVGEVPRRKSGFGTLPAHAADERTGWHPDPLPALEMPYALNPTEGFLATANNKPIADSKGLYLGADWLDGYRAGRISEVLASRDDWDVAASMRLQRDVFSLPWRELRDIITELEPQDLDAVRALTLLRAWDGQMAANSPAATVFSRFLRAMARRIADARAPRSAAWALGLGFTPLMPGTTFAGGRASRIVRRLVEQPGGWFERGWQAEMLDALSEVVADLRAHHGPDASGWCWGDVRPLTLEHPLGVVKALAPVFSRGPFPLGGDGNTVLQAAGSSPMVVPSLRVVVPLGDWESVRFVLPGGQSGNPFSPHYDDQLPLWQRGEGVPIAWSREAVELGTLSKLSLEPLRP